MINPYLVFNGNCKDALAFYRSIFPCDEPKIMNYGDYMPEGTKTPPELLRTWVMHGEMVICGTNIWFADEATSFTKDVNFETFFAEAPQINPNADKIKGVICGVRVEEIDDPLIQNVRRLDKLVDELANGKMMDKILRS